MNLQDAQDISDLQLNLQDQQDLQHNLAARYTLTVTVKVRRQPLVDSITHSDFRTSFLTPNEREAESDMEKKQMRQIQIEIQDRGVHNHTFRQRDPDLQMDLQ